MLSRLSQVLFTCLLAMVLVATGLASGLNVADAQDEASAESEAEPEQESAIDVELYQALDSAGLLDEWFERSPVASDVAFVEVTGSRATVLRRDLLARLEVIERRNGTATDRLRRATLLEAEIGLLEDLLAELQLVLDVQAPSLPAELSSDVADDALLRLEQISEPGHQLGFSVEQLRVAEDHFAVLADEVRHDVNVLGPRENQARLTAQDMTGRFGNIRYELGDLLQLVTTVRQHEQKQVNALGPALDGLNDYISDLHWARFMAPTVIDGIPLIVIDAYVRGAAGLGSCPVDWTLLAGIGRIESRHGTLGGSSVGSSGLVSEPILGPLLDGGATEREEAEAAALAEAEALATELAEAERVAAEIAAVTDWFNQQIWGDPRGPDPEPEEEEEVDPLYGDLSEREEVSDDDDAERDADDADGAADDDEEEGPEEEVEEGNGFAVIIDTDDGRLDGNDRWDRAVGPMQFIPETWSKWATDGNGDGVSDPQNIYDAARSAGRFLCDLSDRRGPSPTTFVLGYNASTSYVRNVLSYANRYSELSLSLPEAE